MTDLSGLTMGLHVMLTEANTSKWKYAIINKALMLNAYNILMGTETLASAGMDVMAIVSFRSCHSKLAGTIGSTLNEGHDALIKNAMPKIAPNDAHGIWKFMVNELESKSTNACLYAAQEILALRKGNAGHENETYSAYGTHCVQPGTIFKNLLPGVKSKTKTTDEFTTMDLVNELTINMIICNWSWVWRKGPTTSEYTYTH